MPNIKFIYLYRDGGNYKKSGQVVFRNPDELSCDFIATTLRRAFMQEGLFIAHQIRVPESFFCARGEASSDDHCYHEYDGVELTLDTPSDRHRRSITQFLSEIGGQAAKGWAAFDPHDAPPY